MMKKIKTFGISLLVAACAVCLSLAFTACKGGDKNANSYGAGEEGFYYYDGADSARYMLSLQSGNYMITANNETQYSGSYSYNEETGEISFSGDTAFTATVGENALSLDMGDSGYSFKAYKYFDVTYVDENGKVVATESVLNGQSAEALEVEKDGYWFVGWFEDANNSSEFAFNTSIAGDTTVYGWYIEKNLTATEYEITLDYGDGMTETVSTMNGAVWTLPSDGILGWWVSATNKSEELTYKYETGTALSSDTTLFAVYGGMGASVTSSGITWENVTGSNVYVSIYGEDGDVILDRASVSSSTAIYAPTAFTSLGTGTYTIVVESGSTTETLTYIVNGLASVSVSSFGIVVNGDGRVLTFAPVEGAAGYTITVDDGVKDPVTEDLGSRTYYNLSGWGMTGTGLTITITAYADGCVSSVSGEYNYLLRLDKVALEMSGDDVVWNRVESALEYLVTVYGENDEVLESVYTTETSYSLKYYDAGTYTISVKPVTDGYWSEETFIYGQAKSTIAAPVICDITDYTITWTEVDGAESYVVMINGTEYTVTEGTTLAFSEYGVPEIADSYEIAVMAVAEEGLDSSYSDKVIATNKTFSSSVTYEKNTVTWNYDVSATSYVVSVNEEETLIRKGNSAEITLNKAGNNEIVVTAYDADGSIGQARIDVYAYAIILDPNGATFENGTSTSTTIYVAQGDTLNLGEVEKDHADFIGWYTQADYTDGQSDVYEGKGSEVVGGSVFTGSRDMYLYAYWSYEYLTVNLYTDINTLYGTVKVKYNTASYEFPVPESTNADSFAGWYTSVNGAGAPITSYNGIYSGSGYGEIYFLYAYFLPLLSYSKTTYNGETVYAVSANTRVDVGLFPEIKIPECYTDGDGTEYGLVLNSNAFYNCIKLEKLEIPDTILYIAVTNDGYRSGTGAFVGCSSLREVDIYATGGEADSAKEVTYFSEDGVLFRKLSGESGDVELVYYPYAKTIEADAEKGIEDGEYVIPSTVSNIYEIDASGNAITHAVTTLPAQVFRERNISKVVIAGTVTSIASQAFYSNRQLTEVVFEGGSSAELEIGDTAFKLCSAITSVTLPARYTNFNANAFVDCTALLDVYFEDGNTEYSSDGGIVLDAAGVTLIYYPAGRSGDVDTAALTSIPDTITKIAANAFVSNAKITSVRISGAVAEIGESAFEDCTGISTIEFGGTDQSLDLTIKSRAFYGCYLVREVKLPSNLVALESNAFGGCTNLLYVYFDARGIGTGGSAASSLSFASNCFGSTSNIQTVEFGPNVPLFEDFGAVFDGGALEEVIVAEDNTAYSSDDYGVLYDANKTTVIYYPLNRVGSYVVPDTVTAIPASVFKDRTGLTSITVGAGVASVAQDAFSGCTYLQKIIVAEGNEYYCSDENGILYKMLGSDEYATGDGLELVYCPLASGVTDLTLPSTVVKTTKNAFYNNPTVACVTFTGEALELGSYSFYGCTSLSSVTLVSGISQIPDYAFYGCTSLTSVEIPSSVTEINQNAFDGCTYLATVKISEGVTKIDTYAFNGCSSLTGDLTNADSAGVGITLPCTLETIGDYAFYQDHNLAVTIPASVTSIGKYAFAECWYNESAEAAIVFAEDEGSGTESELTIGDNAFDNSNYATNLSIPARVTSIGSYAFRKFGTKVTSAGIEFKDVSENCKITELSSNIFNGATTVATICIPASVTTIGASAFNGCTNLTEITWGGTAVNRLTSIGSSAFNGTGITSFTIPSTVTSIGAMAFQNSGLETVTFEENGSLTAVPDYLFSGTPAVEINIPASVTSIGEGVFANCTNLKKVTFQNKSKGETSGLKSFDRDDFYGCSALEEIELPTAMTAYNEDLQGCKALKSISFPATLTSIGSSGLSGCTSLASVTFEVDATGKCALSSIGAGAFKNCSNLTSFEFPVTEGTLTLGAGIFAGSGITTLNIPSNVTDIGEALEGLYLTSITVEENHPTYKVGEDQQILYSSDSGTIAYVYKELSGEYTVPEGITSIAAGAFYGQTGITGVSLPSTLLSIGDYAFYGCTSLVTVTCSGDLSEDPFGEYAFYGCESLKKIDLPEGIKTISNECFENCDLSETTLPRSLTVIGDWAFRTTKIKTAVLPNIVSIGQYAFAQNGRYDDALEEITLGSGLTTVGQYAFRRSNLKSIVLPNGFTGFTNLGAFYDCIYLESVTIPSSVTSIAQDTFRNCSSLKEVVLPDSVGTFGTYVFYGCSSLESVVLPKYLTALGNYTFYGCSSLVSVSIPDTVTQIGTYCFQNCTSLESFEFGSNITSVGNYAFDGCSGLETIIVGKGVTSLGTYVFRNCTSLVYAYTGDKVATLGNYSFCGCTKLETVEFGVALSSIGDYAFQNCSSLKEMSLGNGLTSIGKQAFDSCTSLESVLIPSTVSTIGSSAFASCTCDIYVRKTLNYVTTNWSGWDTSFAGNVYYFSQTEPGLSEDGTAYDGNYWYYDDAGEITLWIYAG